jgi:hypothetical protein
LRRRLRGLGALALLAPFLASLLATFAPLAAAAVAFFLPGLGRSGGGCLGLRLDQQRGARLGRGRQGRERRKHSNVEDGAETDHGVFHRMGERGLKRPPVDAVLRTPPRDRSRAAHGDVTAAMQLDAPATEEAI